MLCNEPEKGSGTNSAKHPKGRSGYWYLTPFPSPGTNSAKHPKGRSGYWHLTPFSHLTPFPSHHRGFSLVELIVVMVILGMLAGLVAVRTRGYLISSKQNAAKAEIANIVKAVETFYADQGRYPTADEGIEILATGTDTWPDGFLNKVPRDPWKNRYEYISPGSTQPYEVICLGADGREGGEGENQDFSSEASDDDA